MTPPNEGDPPERRGHLEATAAKQRAWPEAYTEPPTSGEAALAMAELADLAQCAWEVVYAAGLADREKAIALLDLVRGARRTRSPNAARHALALIVRPWLEAQQGPRYEERSA